MYNWFLSAAPLWTCLTVRAADVLTVGWHLRCDRENRLECSISSRKAYNCTSRGEIGRRKSENIKLHAGILADSWHIETGRDKKDAEALKHDSSPYLRTAETGFDGRKSGLSFLRRNPIGFHQLLWCLCWTKVQITFYPLFRSALF